MAKIERKTQKIFAGSGSSDDTAAFGSMITGQPVYTDDVERLQTTAYEQGWSKAIAANEAPFLEEMNGVQYGFSKQIAYLMQNGIPEWDSNTTYYANTSFCQVNGVIYQSLTDDNTGNDPTTDTTHWQVYFDRVNSDITNKITNCIISAPNGVASYDGATVTVKQGLNVLIPNGKNDNNTLNNINYTVNEDITATLSGACKYILLNSSGEVTLFNGDYFITDTAPTVTALTLYYSPSENKYYLSDDAGANFSEYTGILLGTCIGADSAVTSLTPYQPVDLLKRNDFTELSGIGMPSSRYIDLTLGERGSTYIAPANGWVDLSVAAVTLGSSVSSFYMHLQNLTANVGSESRVTISKAGINEHIPVSKGASFTVYYPANSTYQLNYLRFIYAEGVPSV